MRPSLILLSAAAMLSAGLGAYAAEVNLSTLPCDRAVKRYVEYQPKIPRDYRVERRIGTHRLFIPWAYFLGRPGPWSLNCQQRYDWTSIAFWVPDLQPPEKDLSGMSMLPAAPVESDRPSPGPDEWVLRIIRLAPIRDDDTSVSEMVANSRKFIWRGQRELPDGILTRGGANNWFRLAAQDDVLINCFEASGGFCSVTLDLKDLRLRIWTSYRRSGVHQHDIILAGIRTLLTEWQTKEPRT